MRAAIFFSVFLLLAAPAAAAPALEVVHADQRPGETGRILSFEVANRLNEEIRTRGRIVAISVYGVSEPSSLPVGETIVPGGGSVRIEAAWPEAPSIGQARVLLVLNDGARPSLIESRSFWIIPWRGVILALAGILVMALLFLAVAKLPKFFRERVPSDMLVYVSERDDTVMTLSNRFQVTWQDLVRANRLKPPYNLKPGMRLFVPKHALRVPSASETDKP